MFLITTSYNPSWNVGAKKILFAGEWCRLFSNKKNYERVYDYEVFPYHWLDQDDVYLDIGYLENIYEAYLGYVAVTLNNLHGVNYSKRYWRIILGVWLNDFIRLVYDYFITIQNIDKANIVTNTYITEIMNEGFIPQDFSEFHEFSSHPFYNHCLFSSIIKETSNIPYEVFSSNTHENKLNISSTAKNVTLLQNIKRGIKYVFSFLYSSFLIPSKFKKIVFVSSYFSNQDLTQIQKKLKQLPMIFLFDPLAIKKKANLNLRRNIEIKHDSNNSFELLLDKLIPIHIPISYVENYSTYNLISKFFYPRNPRVIFTANSYYYNEAFKFWAALKTEKGCDLLISQHGAYGESLWSIEESHMIKVSNLFYTWGWNDGTKDTAIMPSNKLNYTKKKMHHNPDGGILCVVNSDIINNMHSQKPMLVDKYLKDYIYTLMEIPKFLDQNLKKKFKYRLYHTNYKRQTWGVKDEFLDNGMGEYIDDTHISFYESVNKSRLTIITYHPNVTGYETLSANLPTLLFWNNDQLKLRANVQKFYDDLEDVGVYHKTLESLIQQIEIVNSDIDKWWYSSKVQLAVKKYCSKFAHTNNNCVDDWVKELSKYQ
jgi:putative transferase (TIGR04331 family)